MVEPRCTPRWGAVLFFCVLLGACTKKESGSVHRVNGSVAPSVSSISTAVDAIAAPSAVAAGTATASPSAVAAGTATASPSAVAADSQTQNDEAQADIDSSAPPLECHLLAAGDSLTDPRSHGGGYLRVVTHACPRCRVTNIARGGAMVNQIRRAVLEHLFTTDEHYSHVVVFGGVNDLYSDQTAHRTVAKIERDLQTIYDAAHARGARVIAVTVSPWGGFARWYNPKRGNDTLALNQWLRQGPTEGRVEGVVDAYALLSCGDPIRLCERFARPFRDGLHFGPEGHELVGRALKAQLGPNFCPKTGAD